MWPVAGTQRVFIGQDNGTGACIKQKLCSGTVDASIQHKMPASIADYQNGAVGLGHGKSRRQSSKNAVTRLNQFRLVDIADNEQGTEPTPENRAVQNFAGFRLAEQETGQKNEGECGKGNNPGAGIIEIDIRRVGRVTKNA